MIQNFVVSNIASMEATLKFSPPVHGLIPSHRACSGTKVLLFKSTSASNLSCNRKNRVSSCYAVDAHRQRSSLESLFCYDKPVPEEIIEKPVGLSIAEKAIGSNPRCSFCHAKGAVLCMTCSGSGLYVDSIMESQGIIVKVRCLGCGGTGNTMCSECGGRGHL